MTKTYFEVDKIETVTLTMETESGMKWHEALPLRKHKFLGITVGISPALPAGAFTMKDLLQNTYAKINRILELMKKR
jgi:hypothetical protein